MAIKQNIYYFASRLDIWLELKFSDHGLREINFLDLPDQRKANMEFASAKIVVSQLDEYFCGALEHFTIPVDFPDVSPFTRMVWDELTRIPYGQTRSYSQIASRIGHPGAARAVGQANSKNPVPIVIPCHRVINSDGSLGGYSSGVALKRRLLDLEFVHFLSDEVP